MSYFAKIENGIVVDTIQSSNSEWVYENLDGEWIEHPDETDRKFRPGVGMSYDYDLDEFLWPKPFESWTLNTETCIWQPPIPKPEEGSYEWHEDTLSWELIIPES